VYYSLVVGVTVLLLPNIPYCTIITCIKSNYGIHCECITDSGIVAVHEIVTSTYSSSWCIQSTLADAVVTSDKNWKVIKQAVHYRL